MMGKPTLRPPSPRRLFALIIGINYYASNTIPPLRGAVSDARAFGDYLKDQLHTPQDHISILENQSASRLAIIEALQRLENDHRIEHGDSIVIYYAGHGCEMAPPPGWEARGPTTNIGFILPYDAFCDSGGQLVPPIPDRTLDALVDAVARVKGDNILVILDSCHSGSGSRTSNSSDIIRSVLPPSKFQFPGHLDQEIWSASNDNLRSHVLLAACGSSGLAWESHGRGAFTAALLDLFQNTDINKLRYCDIPMRVDVGSRQNPYCEGFNRGRYIFTSTLPPATEFFIPVYTRAARNNPHFKYYINGGAAHGLVVGDEFAVYPDMDSRESEGTLVVAEVGPFYSVMRLLDKGIPITGNSVAVRVKGGKPPGSCPYSRPWEKVYGTLTQDSDQDVSSPVIANASKFSRIHTSLQAAQPNVQFGTMQRSNQSFRVGSAAEAFSRLPPQFFSELDRSADFFSITGHVQVEIYELVTSQRPLVPKHLPVGASRCPNEPFSLYQCSSYGLKLTNNSRYDLYPVVQYFDPTDGFKIETLYEPACSRSMLDVPLKNEGGHLTIGYGSGRSRPFFIPVSEGESLGYLKISLFTRPLDPFYQARSFRLARILPETFKGPWATVVLPVIHNRPPAMRHRLPPDYPETFGYKRSHLGLLPQDKNKELSTVLDRDDDKRVLSFAGGLKLQTQVYVSLPLTLQDSQPGFLLHKKLWLKRLLKRAKYLILRYCAAFRRPNHLSPPFSSKHVSSQEPILPLYPCNSYG